MPRLELDFLKSDPPTDDELLLQLVYGLSRHIRDEREEKCFVYTTTEGIPYPEVRRLMRLIVTRCGLPIPIERVDQFVEWNRTNYCWLVSSEMAAEADKLQALNGEQT